MAGEPTLKDGVTCWKVKKITPKENFAILETLKRLF